MKADWDRDDEEDFLQSLASAHTIAAGMLESALKNLRLQAASDVTVVNRLEKSANALRRIEALIVKKRSARAKDDAA